MTVTTASHTLPLDGVLARAARILGIGALLHALIAVLLLLIAAFSAVTANPALRASLQTLVLPGFGGSADAALIAASLLALLDMSLLLVVMVGALAREAWTIPALVVVALANIAALVLLTYTMAILTLIVCPLTVFVIVRDRAARRAFRFNPVMIKELRGRMRGVRAFVVLTVYLALMGTFALLLYLVYSTAGRDPSSAAAGEIGRVLFNGVFAVELALIVFIAPAFTAGAITGERERQTYDLLRTTLLSDASFVIGKLESALGYVLLLLLAGIPLQSLAFLFGGVSEAELILSFVILLITAIALGTLGIYFSAGMDRTLAASVRSYSTAMIVMFVAPGLVGILLGVLRDALFVAGNAVSPALEAVLYYLSTAVGAVSPINTAITTQNLLITQQTAGFFSYTLVSDGSAIPVTSPWILFSIFYITLAAVLMTLTIRANRRVDARAA
jgi:hypothetical protein